MRLSGVIVGLCFLVLGSSIKATSIGSLRPHDPNYARLHIEHLVRAVDTDDLKRFDKEAGGTFFYTNEMGRVDYTEQSKFLESMNRPEGKADQVPMKLDAVRLLKAHKFRPVYLVKLERVVWRLKDYETNDMLLDDEVDRPHFQTETSTWLVAFAGNRVTSFREADEFGWVGANK